MQQHSEVQNQILRLVHDIKNIQESSPAGSGNGISTTDLDQFRESMQYNLEGLIQE